MAIRAIEAEFEDEFEIDISGVDTYHYDFSDAWGDGTGRDDWVNEHLRTDENGWPYLDFDGNGIPDDAIYYDRPFEKDEDAFDLHIVDRTSSGHNDRGGGGGGGG